LGNCFGGWLESDLIGNLGSELGGDLGSRLGGSLGGCPVGWLVGWFGGRDFLNKMRKDECGIVFLNY